MKNHARDFFAGLVNFWKVGVLDFNRFRKPLILRALRYLKIFHKLLAQADCGWQIGRMQIKSTMIGWTKIGKRHYRHESKVEVRKGDRGWEVIGGSGDGHIYVAMWAAMWAATKTPSVWQR